MNIREKFNPNRRFWELSVGKLTQGVLEMIDVIYESNLLE